MSTVNKVILIGRFGQDPELKHTPAGMAVTAFSIATSENWKDKATGEKKEQTEWHRCVAWGAQAENITKYCKKGHLIFIEGKLATRKWEDKDKIVRYTTEIIVGTMQFMQGKSDDTRPPTPSEPPANMSSNTQAASDPGALPFNNQLASDEIPF